MRGEALRREALSVPNLLSYLRIVLIPVFAALFAHRLGVAAACVLVASGLTDLLDGWIARHYGMVTDLGKILDPLADKLTSATVCVCLVIRNGNLFFLLLLFIIKEVLMVIGGARLLKKGYRVEGANWYGKLATFVFYVAMISIIAFDLTRYPYVSEVFIIVPLALMLFAFVMYLRIFLRLVHKNKQDAR